MLPQVLPPAPIRELPNTYFRYGESCTWFKHTFEAGSRLTLHPWVYVSPIPVALEVTALSWQVFTTSTDDLDRLLWECALRWDFGAAKIPIGPLTQATGGLGDHLFPESRGNMERLAETGNGLPSEEMWRILTQGNRIGDTFTFNGRMQYRKHPILIPASAQCALHLYTDSEEGFVFSKTFRIRVILHGVFKNIIEIS